VNLVEQKAHIVKRDLFQRDGQIFRELSNKPEFTQINKYDLNDLLYDQLAWLPEKLSIDSKELIQVNIHTIPVARMGDGNLWVLPEDIKTYWPDLNEISNSYGAVHDMVNAATINHVMSWGIRVETAGLRSQPLMHYDQLRENFDMVVAGAGLDTREDHHYDNPRTTTHLTITVVLLLTAEMLRLVRRQTEAVVAYCDNHLKELGAPEEEEEADMEGAFFDFIRADGFDTTVLLMPGME
jgi:hypothetical protein